MFDQFLKPASGNTNPRLREPQFSSNLGLGKALTPLDPPQTRQVPLNEYEFPENKVANVQSQLERLIEKNYYLHQSAKDAYRSYLLAYNSHSMKDTFNVHRLNLQASSPL